MIRRPRPADRTRYKVLDELQPVSERDSRQDADAIAIHRTKVRRQSNHQFAVENELLLCQLRHIGSDIWKITRQRLAVL